MRKVWVSSCVAVTTGLIACLSAVTAASPPEAECAWPAEIDAVSAAPQHHKVLFENEEVRVLEVEVAPKVKQPIHAHCWPSVLYVTSGTTYVDYDADGKVLFDSREAPSPSFPIVEWMGPQAPHAVHNLGDDPVRLIRVEVKRAQR